MTKMKRKDIRKYHVELFDGRGTATVMIVDGYDRPVSSVRWVEAVHTREEAISAAIAQGFWPQDPSC